MANKENEKIYYVYQYVTVDGTPYYIGKGKNNRINVRHLVVVPPVEQRQIIRAGLTNDEAKELEIELIKKYKRKVDGGILENRKINQWACYDGWKHTEEAKARISKNNIGKVRTAEHKQHYSKPKTKEHSENIQNAVKLLWSDPVYKAKRLQKMKETRDAKRELTNG